MKLSGSCLCGAIECEMTAPFNQFTHCYCKLCRKATGSGRSSALIASPSQLRWTKGKDKVKRWDMPTASRFATSFCSECGCPLPRLTRNGGFAVISAGSINSDLSINPECHEHYASKANWVCLDETHLPVYDGGSK
jgi:hypothetical protein